MPLFSDFALKQSDLFFKTQRRNLLSETSPNVKGILSKPHRPFHKKPAQYVSNAAHQFSEFRLESSDRQKINHQGNSADLRTKYLGSSNNS